MEVIHGIFINSPSACTWTSVLRVLVLFCSTNPIHPQIIVQAFYTHLSVARWMLSCSRIPETCSNCGACGIFRKYSSSSSSSSSSSAFAAVPPGARFPSLSQWPLQRVHKLSLSCFFPWPVWIYPRPGYVFRPVSSSRGNLTVVSSCDRASSGDQSLR